MEFIEVTVQGGKVNITLKLLKKSLMIPRVGLFG